VFNTSYGAIKATLEAGGKEENVKNISEAVCSIRNSKLPNPMIIGNAGSFFKNPEVGTEVFARLQLKFPTMPGYPVEENKVKIPAGWLIEQCGWKGKRVGNTGSHKDQALVLVNYGGAEGNEVKALAMQIQKDVKDTFGVEIQAEVNII
jgi:UDP-N-acetylmuramate dehydrogenase